jgi:hypothetical protein
MQVEGALAARAFGSEPDIVEWASRTALNPARIPADYAPTPALDQARERLSRFTAPGLARLTELASAS